MATTTCRTRRRPGGRQTVEVLQLLRRPQQPLSRPASVASTSADLHLSPAAAARPPLELEQQIAAIAKELARPDL